MIATWCQPPFFYASGQRSGSHAHGGGYDWLLLGKPQALSGYRLIPLQRIVMTASPSTGLTGKTVQWGGRRFRLMDGGIMRELA